MLRKAINLWRLLLVILAIGAAGPAFAEDGYDLWLRYHPLPDETQERYAPATRAIVRSFDAIAATSGTGSAPLAKACRSVMSASP